MKNVFAIVALAAAAGMANADTLAANPQDFGANFGLGFFSDGDAGYWYSQQVAENFSIGAASNVTGVNFAGASEFFEFGDYTNMTGFNIQIMADAGGLPGAVIYSEVIATGATSPTLQGVNVLGSNVYGQSATFASSVALGAGNYWVSIGAVLASGAGDAWVWADGTNDDGIAFTTTPNAGGWAPYADGATSGTFEIIGTVVPAPSSMALLGLGALAAGRRRR